MLIYNYSQLCIDQFQFSQEQNVLTPMISNLTVPNVEHVSD